MEFEKPDFVEIRMDAEIGSYQQDDREEGPAFVTEEAAAE
jgi:hypothetical protein